MRNSSTNTAPRGVAPVLAEAEAGLKASLAKLKRLRPDPALARREPDDLRLIRRLRPSGPRRLRRGLDRETYREKLEGALLARMAGCTLGAPVEGWPVAKMEDLARENGEPFPPVDYWTRVPAPFEKRYRIEPARGVHAPEDERRSGG